MNTLLDTHVFLWWLDTPDRIPSKARSVIENPKNLLFVSIVSVWEIAIKEAIKKLTTTKRFQEVLESGEYPILSVELSHVQRFRQLPLHHRDPFDRMLLAQALAEGLTLITHDPTLKRYNVPILLA